MKTYKEHYQYCKEVNPIEGGIHNSVYDLTIDDNLFDDYIDEIIMI